MPTSIRQKKVAAQIQRIVATVLQRDVADPRVDGLISVTRVEVSPDLREARVYLSLLGGKRTPATVLEGIKSAGRHIQGEVASNLPLRFAPRLTYILDGTLKKQAEILRKIHETMAEDAAARPAAADAPADAAADSDTEPSAANAAHDDPAREQEAGDNLREELKRAPRPRGRAPRKRP
jgi:ribosome-binding factor A